MPKGIAVDSAGVETRCTLTLRCEAPSPIPPVGEEREDLGGPFGGKKTGVAAQQKSWSENLASSIRGAFTPKPKKAPPEPKEKP